MKLGLVALLLIFVLVLLFRGRASHRGGHAGNSTRAATDAAIRTDSGPNCDTGNAPPTISPTIRGAAYVLDGDTLVIARTRIRLFGIDAPELQHPYGIKAKRALVSLCKGQSVRAEVTDQDDYGRTVARCFLDDGRDLSEEMVKLGLALDWPRFSGGTYRAHERPDARKRLWLAAARQKGQMHVWDKYDKRQKAQART